MTTAHIALVGDFDPQVTAHQAIERSFELARQMESLPVEPSWVGTETIVANDGRLLDAFQGIWCVPASPYRNTAGALWAIRFAREGRLPFLGTCGGFQHAILEYARNALHVSQADHAELHPDAQVPLLHRLECSLVETSQRVIVIPGHPFSRVYGADSGLEGYRCGYGLNPSFEHLFQKTPLEIVARDESGAVRAVALRDHPFFVGTLFQPERKALTGSLHPVVRAFFMAALRAKEICQA